MIVLDLPYPPSINNYWIASGHRRFISKRGVLFRQSVMEYVMDNEVPKLGDQGLSVHIVLRPRSKKLMDIDNCAKAILDACEHAGIFDSDVQVEKLLIERGLPKKGGGCVVMIEVIPFSSEKNPQG
jgi:crossover junction endodeoxyribonuclease RusA